MSTSHSASSDDTALRARRRFVLVKRLAVLALLAFILVIALHYPYDVDAPLSDAQVESNRKYYEDAYLKPVPEKEQGSSEYESRYTQVAKAAAEHEHIEDQVKEFVKGYDLEKRPVLEIGSGRGYLRMWPKITLV
ncbi:MAG: hypothetical protein ABSH35_11730 [Isosphaeraceae bacterium]|jgi:hypothetical protein